MLAVLLVICGQLKGENVLISRICAFSGFITGIRSQHKTPKKERKNAYDIQSIKSLSIFAALQQTFARQIFVYLFPMILK